MWAQLHRMAITLFTFAESFFGTLALGHVNHGNCNAYDLSGLVPRGLVGGAVGQVRLPGTRRGLSDFGVCDSLTP